MKNDHLEENQDWGDIPDTFNFYGREDEMATLRHWIVEEKCKIVPILGIAGIGKTSLSVKLAKTIYNDFEVTIWRKLVNAPPIQEILIDLLKTLSSQRLTKFPKDISGQVSMTVQFLKEKRCLVVLDNLEAVLAEGEYPAGNFREGYEGYELLLEKLGQINHQSCLLFTSREKPRIIDELESKTKKIKSLHLVGLDISDGKHFFLESECYIEQDNQAKEWRALIEFFNGNPLALKLAAKHIQDVYFGNISEFLKTGKPIFYDLKELINWHFNRLSYPEKLVMYLLAINREPTAIKELESDILSPILKNQIHSIVQLLKRRITLDTTKRKFSLPPVLIEYMTSRLIESIDKEIEIQNPIFVNYISGNLVDKITKEIETNQIHWLNVLPLMKAFSKDFIRESQKRLIIRLIVENLIFYLGSQKKVEEKFRRLLDVLRKENTIKVGYAAGNILNMLCEMKSDLSKFDFSNLYVWQTYLQYYNFQNVNFSYSDLSKSLFAQTFSSIQSVAIDLNGEYFAAGDTNGEIQIWSLKDGQHINTLTGHTNWIRDIAFNPNGETLASASDDHTIKVWNFLNKNDEPLTLRGHTNWVRSISFSKDGKLIASGSDDQTMKIWNISKKSCLTTIPAHSKAIKCVKFHPDGTLVATCSDDQTIKLWSVQSGNCLHTLIGHTDAVESIDFNLEGHLLTSGSSDKTIKIWDFKSQKCLHTFEGHEASVNSIIYSQNPSSNDEFILSGSSDKTIKIWNVSDRVCSDTLIGHSNAVLSLEYNSASNYLISGGEDQAVKLWEIDNGKSNSLRTLIGYSNLVWKVTFSPDGKLIASGNDDKTVKLWDVQTGKYLASLQGHTQWIQSVAFNQSGRILASASADHTIMLWEVPENKLLKVLTGHIGWVVSVAFKPNNSIENAEDILASGSSDHTVRLWSSTTGECIKIFTGHTNWVWSVAFSPDGKLLASGSEDMQVKLWDVESGKCLKTFAGHTKGIWSIDFSSDGEKIASAGVDREIRIWDVNTGKCLNILEGHSDWIGSVAFSPDVAILASGSSDKTIRLWDVHSGKCIGILKGHENWIWSVHFSPNRLQLASGSQDKSIKIWNLSDQKCDKTLIAPRPYEGMNIKGVTGLTDTQKKSLFALGAVEIKESTIITKPKKKQVNVISKGVFISYSHQDEVWKDRLLKHLKPLEKENLLISWNDRQIMAGDNWLESIMKAINEVKIAVILVSADSLSSNFILEKEVPIFLKRHQNNELRIIPIIIKPCVWKIITWISTLQVRPLDGKPLSTYPENEIDVVLTDLAMEIYELL